MNHLPITSLIVDMKIIFSVMGARAERLSCDFLGEIPLETSIRQLSDAGTPVVIVQTSQSTIYEHIAKKI